jgi:hypothetical protein
MNKQLLRLVHDVKYREIGRLVGQRITISSLEAISADVAAAVQPYALACGTLELRSRDMELILAKYKMLDLSFVTSKTILTKSDRINRKRLESLGFVSSREDVKTIEDVIADVEGKDPSMMADLVRNAQVEHEWLKVFLDVWPARDALAEYMENIEKVTKSGVSNDEADSVAFDALLLRVRDLFPGQFLVRDACITNSDFVWFNKHFYM